MRNRIVLSLALAFLMAPLAFAGQDAKATNAADSCFQVTDLALAQSQPQVVMVGILPGPGPGPVPGGSVGECVSRCEDQRQAIFRKCQTSGEVHPSKCARIANDFAQSCKANCRARKSS